MLRILLTAAVLAAVAGASPASAEIATNRITGNKLAVNGTSLNRLSANGTSLNKLAVNGSSLNGNNLNGVSVNGTDYNGVTLNGRGELPTNVMFGAAEDVTSIVLPGGEVIRR